jgi:hypothetical protein
VRNWHRRLLLRGVLKELLNFLYFVNKKLVNPFSSFLLNIVFDHGSFGE